MRLTNTYHPMEFLLKKSKFIIQGIDCVDLVYRTTNKELNAIFDNKIATLNNEMNVSLQQKRASIIHPSWYQRGEVYQFTSTNRQLKLEDEDSLTTLILPFPSIVDSHNDLLIIHFHSRIGIKNFDKAFKNLTTDEKSLISSLLYNSLNNDLQTILKEQKSFEQIKLHYAKVTDENEALKSRLSSTEEMYKSAMIRLTYNIIKDLEEEHKCQILLDDSAIHKIIINQLSYDQLKTAISNAFYIAYNLSMGLNIIEINQSHLDFERTKENTIQQYQFSGDKIIALLERYEVAAEIAFEKGYSINGKNVAANLNPPVTPPAITDALKKNDKKIALLLEQFPNKWKLIRKNLKPLIIHQDKLAYRFRSTG